MIQCFCILDIDIICDVTLFLFLIQQFPAAPAPVTASVGGWMANPSILHHIASVGPIGLFALNSARDVMAIHYFLFMAYLFIYSFV